MKKDLTALQQSKFLTDEEHLALKQAFIDLEDFGLEFSYSIIEKDPITGFKGYHELERFSDDESVKAVLGIQRKFKVGNERTLIPILIVEEKIKYKEEGAKRNSTLIQYAYRVPAIEYISDSDKNFRGFVCSLTSNVHPRYPSVIDACNVAIQRYEELYYHYYWLHHIQKLSYEFSTVFDYHHEFIEKVQELDQFKIFKLKLVDNHALLTCEKLQIHKSFNIDAAVQQPKDHFFKLRDITIKYLKAETDIIFKIITIDFLTMSK